MCAFTRNSDDVPVFILAPPRSFTSILCAMLGQHPQMYGFPETQLFVSETLGDQWGRNLQSKSEIKHGLLRAVAQLYFGGQTEDKITLARAWLRRRAPFNTGHVFEILMDRVKPLMPVEKSPDVVYDMRSLRRILSFFPHSRFIHLLRHPKGHGESNVAFCKKVIALGGRPHPWMFSSALIPRDTTVPAKLVRTKVLDPQHGWYVHNSNVLRFLCDVPERQQMRIRGEDLLTNPDQVLGQIAGWLDLCSDAAAIERMKHPECSPYAFLGPPGARWGNSDYFLKHPEFRSDRLKLHSLEGTPSWLDNGQELLPAVKQLARQFGYE